MAKTESLYQTVIDNVTALLTAVKAEAKTNKRLANSVARLERLAKTLLPFKAKYVRIVEAKADKPEAEAKPAKKAAKKTAKKAAKKAAPEPAKKAAKKAKKKATAAPTPAVVEDEVPEEATIN